MLNSFFKFLLPVVVVEICSCSESWCGIEFLGAWPKFEGWARKRVGVDLDTDRSESDVNVETFLLSCFHILLEAQKILSFWKYLSFRFLWKFRQEDWTFSHELSRESNNVMTAREMTSVASDNTFPCLGLIHTGRARATQANGTNWCEWEYPHCTQATSKEKRSNLCTRRVPRPVWIGP